MSSVNFRNDLTFQQNIDELSGLSTFPRRRHHLQYLAPIRRLAEELGSSEMELYNAEYLARSDHAELCIILKEPCDNSRYKKGRDMVARSPTLQHVDEVLESVSSTRYNLENTAILDFKLLRTQAARKYERVAERRRKDDLAVLALEECVQILNPKVIIVCHCGWWNGGPHPLSSSLADAGSTNTYITNNGSEATVVYAFHPSVFLREDYGCAETENLSEEEALNRCVLHDFLFEICFAVALKATQGITVGNLQEFRRAVYHNEMVDDLYADDNYALARLRSPSVGSLTDNLANLNL